MGIRWSFLNPILMSTVCTFVFNVVFRARWGGEGSKFEFAIIRFVGLIIHALSAECVNRAPSLILGNVTYVKKVVFPLDKQAGLLSFEVLQQRRDFLGSVDLGMQFSEISIP